MQANETGILTLLVAAAMGAYLRVKDNGSNRLIVAGAEDEEIGTTRTITTAAGESVGVVSRCAPGTRYYVAAGAFAKYATVYGAANGKIDDTPNSRRVGIALQASTADNDIVEVMPIAASDALGDLDGKVILDDDFIGDYPAAGTAIPGGRWTKVETNALGVISSDEANGVLKFSADAVAEAATATLLLENSPFDIDQHPIFECRLAVFDIGDAAAVDIDFGLASDDHATDFEAIAAFAAFHLDGTDLSVKCHSDDGTTDTAAVDSTVDLVDDTYATFKIDVTDKSDVKFYINGTRVCAGTTFDISEYAGTLTPIVMVEKTNDDTTFDVRVDRIRVSADRN